MPFQADIVARYLGVSQSPASEPATERPGLRGALRGLDMENILSQPVARSPTEHTEPDIATTAPRRHQTRSTKHGRADVNYSQKYHPMDEVTRPKRASRITGSRSLSVSTLHHESTTSDEDDEPELESASDTDVDDPSDQSDTAAAGRTPDPRAVRHSARAQAKKLVDYSKKRHPQDWAIFGRRRSTKRKRQSQPDKPQKRGNKQATDETPVVVSSDRVAGSDDDEDDDDDEEPDVVRPLLSVASSAKQIQEDSSSCTETAESGSLAALPQGGSFSNSVDDIIRGKRIIAQDHDEAATDNISSESSSVIATRAEDVIAAIVGEIKTSDTTSYPASDIITRPNNGESASALKGMPNHLVTPGSMAFPLASVKTQLAINRPYMATQVEPRICEAPVESRQVQSPARYTERPSPATTPRSSELAPVQGPNEDNLLEEQSHDSLNKVISQAEHSATTSPASAPAPAPVQNKPNTAISTLATDDVRYEKQHDEHSEVEARTGHSLASSPAPEPTSKDAISTKSCAVDDNLPPEHQHDELDDIAASQEADDSTDAVLMAGANDDDHLDSGSHSREDTESNEGDGSRYRDPAQVSSSSHFEEAMADTLGDSQGDCDDNLLQAFSDEFAQLPVSQREREDIKQRCEVGNDHSPSSKEVFVSSHTPSASSLTTRTAAPVGQQETNAALAQGESVMS